MAARSKNPQRRGRSNTAAPPAAGGNWLLYGAAALALLVAVLVITSRGSEGADSNVPKAAAAPGTSAAVALATRFNSRYQNVEAADRYEATSELTAMAAPSFVETLTNKIDAMYDLVDEGPLPSAASDGTARMARIIPISRVVEKRAPDAIDVTIWAATLAGIDGVVTPRVTWSRNQISLALTGGKWKVTGMRKLEALVPSTIVRGATAEEDFWNKMKGAQFYAGS